jgi:hypothetical protein
MALMARPDLPVLPVPLVRRAMPVPTVPTELMALMARPDLLVLPVPLARRVLPVLMA